MAPKPPIAPTGRAYHGTGFAIPRALSVRTRRDIQGEFVAADLSDLSTTIFAGEIREPGVINYNDLLRRIGQNAARTTNAREGLVSLRRVHGFFTETGGNLSSEQVDEHWRITGKDVIALTDHANFVSSKVTFILDVTLGLINSEQNTINSQQNKIIKLFSVFAPAGARTALDPAAALEMFQHEWR